MPAWAFFFEIIEIGAAWRHQSCLHAIASAITIKLIPRCGQIRKPVETFLLYSSHNVQETGIWIMIFDDF